jgi:HSP20 family protein
MTTKALEKGAAGAAVTEHEKKVPSYLASVDIFETADAFHVLADLPGVKAKDIDVRYEDGELAIHAKVTRRQALDAKYLYHGYQAGDFYRRFSVGKEIDAGAIQADYKEGVLTLHVPKAESAKPRKIAVNG